MKDTLTVYYIEQLINNGWQLVEGSLGGHEIDARVLELCNENPGVAFRKVEAEILEVEP